MTSKQYNLHINKMHSSKKEHWENVFSTKQETEVSWYESKPETSLRFFTENAIPTNAKIIDIGGGDSYLIDHLLDLGYTELTVLDISENAINRLKNRLGSKAIKVTFIVSDIIDFKPKTSYDVWHDRASFHFLTQKEDIQVYKNLVANAITSEGFLFIGTFSQNGPLKCSGLEITQYSEEKFESIFDSNFEKVHCFTENHQTPFDTMQHFIFCTFKKRNILNL